ncbi:MAG: hypothetical protein CL553_12645 [Alcanivorax sp.]|nr:hypothetical protein [Alcanivorax sp.]|tara:strand:- start:1969 stop:2556 length:588 start_codon:yes stop_codon:yes gene_type:complete
MPIELAAIITSIIASSFALILAKLIKKISLKSEKIIYLKNKKGETQEIFLDASYKNKDVQEYLDSALGYEREVGEILKKYGHQIVHNYVSERHNKKYNIDYLLKDGERNFFFEIKFSKRPLSVSNVLKIIDQLPRHSHGNVIVSTSGFTESALEAIKKTGKDIRAVSGSDREELMPQFDEFAEAKGIINRERVIF